MSQVADATRNEVKQLVYALNYGMGPSTLARKMDCSVDKAKGYLDGLRERYPELVSSTFQMTSIASCLSAHQSFISSQSFKYASDHLHLALLKIVDWWLCQGQIAAAHFIAA